MTPRKTRCSAGFRVPTSPVSVTPVGVDLVRNVPSVEGEDQGWREIFRAASARYLTRTGRGRSSPARSGRQSRALARRETEATNANRAYGCQVPAGWPPERVRRPSHLPPRGDLAAS